MIASSNGQQYLGFGGFQVLGLFGSTTPPPPPTPTRPSSFPPLFNANSLLLSRNIGTLPNVQSAMFDWFIPIKAIQVVKVQVNYQTVEAGTPRPFQGVIQPFTSRQLQMKPEGQRAWDWVMIHCFPTITFQNDDQLWVDDTRYRIMGPKNYSKYGYLMYEAIQDYQDQSTSPPLPNEEDLAKFVELLTITDPLTVLVDPSADIVDATDAIWKLYDVDHGNTPVIGAVTVVSAIQVQVTVYTPGNYRLIGAS